MKLPTNLRLGSDLARLIINLNDLISRTNQQINQVTEGKVTAIHNAATAAPTTGTHEQGDQIRNTAPSELGSASSKYVIVGWVCVASGTPGTWREMRVLTGN